LALAAALGTETGAPARMFEAIATVRLPWTGPPTWDAARLLRRELWQRRRIELHVTALGGALWARISAAAYNEEADYAELASALGESMAIAIDGMTS
jgi:hypothetical protein